MSDDSSDSDEPPRHARYAAFRRSLDDSSSSSASSSSELGLPMGGRPDATRPRSARRTGPTSAAALAGALPSSSSSDDADDPPRRAGAASHVPPRQQQQAVSAPSRAAHTDLFDPFYEPPHSAGPAHGSARAVGGFAPPVNLFEAAELRADRSSSDSSSSSSSSVATGRVSPAGVGQAATPDDDRPTRRDATMRAADDGAGAASLETSSSTSDVVLTPAADTPPPSSGAAPYDVDAIDAAAAAVGGDTSPTASSSSSFSPPLAASVDDAPQPRPSTSDAPAAVVPARAALGLAPHGPTVAVPTIVPPVPLVATHDDDDASDGSSVGLQPTTSSASSEVDSEAGDAPTRPAARHPPLGMALRNGDEGRVDTPPSNASLAGSLDSSVGSVTPSSLPVFGDAAGTTTPAAAAARRSAAIPEAVWSGTRETPSHGGGSDTAATPPTRFDVDDERDAVSATSPQLDTEGFDEDARLRARPWTSSNVAFLQARLAEACRAVEYLRTSWQTLHGDDVSAEEAARIEHVYATRVELMQRDSEAKDARIAALEAQLAETERQLFVQCDVPAAPEDLVQADDEDAGSPRCEASRRRGTTTAASSADPWSSEDDTARVAVAETQTEAVVAAVVVSATTCDIATQVDSTPVEAPDSDDDDGASAATTAVASAPACTSRDVQCELLMPPSAEWVSALAAGAAGPADDGGSSYTDGCEDDVIDESTECEGDTSTSALEHSRSSDDAPGRTAVVPVVHPTAVRRPVAARDASTDVTDLDTAGGTATQAAGGVHACVGTARATTAESGCDARPLETPPVRSVPAEHQPQRPTCHDVAVMVESATSDAPAAAAMPPPPRPSVVVDAAAEARPAAADGATQTARDARRVAPVRGRPARTDDSRTPAVSTPDVSPVRSHGGEAHATSGAESWHDDGPSAVAAPKLAERRRSTPRRTRTPLRDVLRARPLSSTPYRLRRAAAGTPVDERDAQRCATQRALDVVLDFQAHRTRRSRLVDPSELAASRLDAPSASRRRSHHTRSASNAGPSATRHHHHNSVSSIWRERQLGALVEVLTAERVADTSIQLHTLRSGVDSALATVADALAQHAASQKEVLLLRAEVANLQDGAMHRGAAPASAAASDQHNSQLLREAERSFADRTAVLEQQLADALSQLHPATPQMAAEGRFARPRGAHDAAGHHRSSRDDDCSARDDGDRRTPATSAAAAQTDVPPTRSTAVATDVASCVAASSQTDAAAATHPVATQATPLSTPTAARDVQAAADVHAGCTQTELDADDVDAAVRGLAEVRRLREQLVEAEEHAGELRQRQEQLLEEHHQHLAVLQQQRHQQQNVGEHHDEHRDPRPHAAAASSAACDSRGTSTTPAAAVVDRAHGIMTPPPLPQQQQAAAVPAAAPQQCHAAVGTLPHETHDAATGTVAVVVPHASATTSPIPRPLAADAGTGMTPVAFAAAASGASAAADAVDADEDELLARTVSPAEGDVADDAADSPEPVQASRIDTASGGSGSSPAATASSVRSTESHRTDVSRAVSPQAEADNAATETATTAPPPPRTAVPVPAGRTPPHRPARNLLSDASTEDPRTPLLQRPVGRNTSALLIDSSDAEDADSNAGSLVVDSDAAESDRTVSPPARAHGSRRGSCGADEELAAQAHKAVYDGAGADTQQGNHPMSPSPPQSAPAAVVQVADAAVQALDEAGAARQRDLWRRAQAAFAASMECMRDENAKLRVALDDLVAREEHRQQQHLRGRSSTAAYRPIEHHARPASVASSAASGSSAAVPTAAPRRGASAAQPVRRVGRHATPPAEVAPRGDSPPHPTARRGGAYARAAAGGSRGGRK